MEPETRHMFSALPKSSGHQYKIKCAKNMSSKYIRGRQPERKEGSDSKLSDQQLGFNHRYERRKNSSKDAGILPVLTRTNSKLARIPSKASDREPHKLDKIISEF